MSQHFFAAPVRLFRLLFANVPVDRVLFVFSKQAGQCAGPVVGEVGTDAGLLILDALQQRGEHHLRRVLVGGEGGESDHAFGISVFGVPLL
ncbi:hypothetical protein [Frigoriglobus tundricola]|uniref:hypothetical protein n=1 Tax=Frigoriglobus tundricola TaxID=2774151 RepID=UPI00148ECFF7|nr:hypothetical protein [Frigoriglobus tundricola]